MSDTRIPNDAGDRTSSETIEKSPRGFKTARSSEPVPADDDPEPVQVDDSVRRPGTDGHASGVDGDSLARTTIPTEASETSTSSEQNNVVMFDQAKVCPSRYFDSKTAEKTLLNDVHPDGSKRDSYLEFKYRLGKYRKDISEGRLPPEAVFYDFPEELYDRTPEQIKEFFDRIVYSTGIGKGVPEVTPMGLHPFLFRMFERIGSEERGDAARRFLLLRNDVETIRRRREEEAAKPASSLTEVAPVAVKHLDGNVSSQSEPAAARDRPMGMEGIPRRREAASHPSEEASTALGVRDVDRRDPTSGAGGSGPVTCGPGQVGLLSGLWYGLGAAAHGIGHRIHDWGTRNRNAPSAPSGASAPAADRPFPEVTNPLWCSVLDSAVRDAAHGLDQDIEAIERDCRTLVDLAAWTREPATRGPVAEALRGLEKLAARRGVSTDAVWKDVHAVAKGTLHDREVASVAEALAKAVDSVDTHGSLARMAEARERVESASRRVLDRFEQDGSVDMLKLKRFGDAMDSLKDADAAFEKPGEEREIRRIAEMARRIAEMFRRLVNRLLGRGRDVEEAPAPPGP